MKTKDDFKRALGPADPGFEHCIHQTLTKLYQNEEDKPVKKISTSLILVMVLLLIVAVAFAAASQWGVLDFMEKRGGTASPVLPAAADLIQQNVQQKGGETDQATFSVREAIYDGQQLYMVIAVTPKADNLLLLGSGVAPSDPMGRMGPGFEEQSQTIMGYANQQGGLTLLRTHIFDEASAMGMEGYFNEMDSVLEEDGTLVYMLRGPYTAQESPLSVKLICLVTPFVDVAVNDVLDIDQEQQAELTFTLQDAEVSRTVASREPVEFADCGVRVDRVTLSGTAMSTQVQVEFTVVDEAAFALMDGGLWFEFLDESGNVIPDGVGGGSVGPVPGSEEPKYTQNSAMAAVETLPTQITLRAYNALDKNRYEAHVFELQ